MVLSKSVDPEDVLRQIRNPASRTVSEMMGNTHMSPYAQRYATMPPVSKHELPENGVGADAAYHVVHDELDFDGQPNLNLASFVHTWMEPKATQLMMENISKNLADGEEYPALQALHARCVSMIARLWKKSSNEQPIGSATTGSSEAILLGGLAMKRRWQLKRKAEGKPTDKPNVILGANAHCSLEKFARYFEVEARIVPVSAESCYVMDHTKLLDYVDENTIGVYCILGSTYTGHFEDVEKVCSILDEYEARTGQDVPVHVDGASGGMVAPFAFPNLRWSFELPRVKSINTSGHKFGLVYAGLGWIVWRDESYLPKDLIFELHYLGATEESFTLNFSRPGAQVIAQYFNFLHLGFAGYRNVAQSDLYNARVLSKAIEATNYYECVSGIHRKRGVWSYSVAEAVSGLEEPEYYNHGLPVVAFRFTKDFRAKFPELKQVLVSTLLRNKGWIIPNYPLPPNEQASEILRVVVRESLTAPLIDRLVQDIIAVTEHLMNADTLDINANLPASYDAERTAATTHLLTTLDQADISAREGSGEFVTAHHREQMKKRRDKGIFSYPC